MFCEVSASLTGLSGDLIERPGSSHTGKYAVRTTSRRGSQRSWNRPLNGSLNRRGTPIAINTIVSVVIVMNSRLAKFVAVAAIFSFVTGAFADTRSVTLSWDANTEPDIAGYKVYWGTSSGVYDKFSDVSQTTASVSDLAIGIRYYFAVKAYNEAGLESGYSEEVSAIVPSPDSSPAPQYLLNISTRVRVGGGDDVMIGGFIIEGDSNKDVLFRALGPSLASVGVPRVLADPTLEVYDSTGTLINQNDNWTTLPSGTVPAGFEPSNPAEAVVVASLAPGSYTAVLRGADGTEGNALCELYDLSPGNSTVRNISTRGEVGTGDDVMIGGFIIGGTTPAKIMVRAIGPSLAAFGVSGVLPDPVLELYDKDGSLIYQNDNWRAEQAQQIIDTTIPPSDESESAIIATLAPDAYTAIVHDAGTAQGVALVEVYMLDQ